MLPWLNLVWYFMKFILNFILNVKYNYHESIEKNDSILYINYIILLNPLISRLICLYKILLLFFFS